MRELITTLAIAGLAAAICQPAFAQESTSQEKDSAKRAGEAQSDKREAKDEPRRQTDRRRSDRRSRTVEVKDPAEFAKLQDKSVFSGPQKGEKLPHFTATSLVGKDKGEQIDPIALAGGRPQILIFQDDSGVAVRGLFGMTSVIAKIDKASKAGLRMATVFLTDDSEKMTAFAGRFADRLQEAGMDVIGMSKDGRDGPGSYGLNRTVSQTIILAKGGKVLHNFVFPQGSLFADPHVIGGIAELIGEKPEAVAAWANAPMLRDSRMGMSDRGTDSQVRVKMALRARLAELVDAGKITGAEARDLYMTAFPPSRSDANNRKRPTDSAGDRARTDRESDGAEKRKDR